MKQKFIAVFFSVVLIMALTACDKNTTKNSTEPAKELPKYGYREYTCDYTTGERYLSTKFENLETERTLTQYSSKGEKVSSVEKWYYDSTGEHLLKHVNWTGTYATESEEYDMKGRLIRKSAKKEGNRAENQTLFFPSEYSTYSKKENKEIGLMYFMANDYTDIKSDVLEIVTEYTYFDGSDTIKGIKTVTDSGTVIGSLERGEGDIILSAKIDGEYIQYEETYDPATGRSEFVFHRFDDDKTVSVTINGVREYDTSGNYIRIIMQNDGGQVVEVSYEYDADGGYMTSLEKQSSEGVKYLVSTDWYDAEGRPLHGESQRSGLKRYEYSYYENGEPLRYLQVEYGSDEDDQRVRIEREFFEDGTIRSNKVYEQGLLTGDILRSFVEMPGVADRVLYMKYVSSSGEETEEKYSIFKPDVKDPTETTEVIYRSVFTDAEGNSVCDKQGQFDSEGHLIRVEETAYGEDVTKAEEVGCLLVTEFDEKGRKSKTRNIFWPNTKYNSGDIKFERGIEWEYWEGEDPLAAEN